MPAKAASTPSEALRALAPELESRIAGMMDGFAGMIVRAHLPQRWVFVTERASATLAIGKDGQVLVTDGAADAPDVVIETSWERLEAALRTRDRSKVPPGPLSVETKTEKGRRAFELVRSRLGL